MTDEGARLADIFADWQERTSRGDVVDPEDVVRAHPELADRLRARFAALAALDEALADSAPGSTVPDAIGDYRVVSELGSGGMGTVYLAESADDSPVALKVLHSHLLARPGFYKRFLREAESGKRVDHPNVVRTLGVDAALVDGSQVDYLVMEYVEGQTLAALLAKMQTVPESLLRQIALQLVQGLAAIHASGIVHRDLKPENALITDDRRVRIMDLGVARLVEESEVLTQEGQFAGSLVYAAPEQFGGGEVGPRADLYSLGVLLYELATGENPFRHAAAAAVMAAHLETVPASALQLNPDLSPFLGEVLAVLLSKDPAERFESSAGLEEILTEGERSAWWRECESRVLGALPRLPRVPVRRETELHGREADLVLLEGAWSRAESGEGNTILLTGEAGIGKSRLVDAFLARLDGGDAHVLYGSYPPSGGLGGLSEALLDHFGAGDLESLLRKYLTLTPGLVPAFSALVKQDVPPEGSQPVKGDALHAVFVQLMRALAEERPLLWIVEDLHFSEPESRKLILSLARAVEGHRVLLLLTTRPGLPEEDLAHFSRLSNFRRTELTRLSAREVILLLKDAFRSEALAEKLGGRIALKSDGVPFFIFEMIRGLREGQFITELPDGSWVETQQIERIEVPSAVRDLIGARLRGLSVEDRALLDLGAVQGYEFDPDLLAQVRQLSLFDVLERLTGIERRSGVVRAHGRRVRFDHHQIQEVLYEDLPERLREECHAATAQAVAWRTDADERDPRELEGSLSGDLCEHLLKGARGREALRYLDAAMDHLEACFLNDRGVSLADRALGMPGLLKGDGRIPILLRKNRHLDLLGRSGEQENVLDEARALAEAGHDRGQLAEVKRATGVLFLKLGCYEEARAHLEQSLTEYRQIGHRKGEAAANGSLGNVFRCLGRFEEARTHTERFLAISREIGDRHGEAVATGNLGVELEGLGRCEEAQMHLEQHVAISREIGDREGEARALNNLGGHYSSVGNLSRARAMLEEARGIWLEIGDRQGGAANLMSLGGLFLSLRRYEEARENLEQSLTIFRDIGVRQFEARVLGNLGLVFQELGRFEEAQEHIEQNLAIAREIGDRQSEATQTGNLGLVLYCLGRYAESLSHYRQYLAVSREIGFRRGEAVALANLGGIWLALGDRNRARSALEESRGICSEIGFRPFEGHVLRSLAALLRESNDPDRALDLATRALTLRREIGDGGAVADSRIQLGELLADRGETEKAWTHLEEAKALILNTDLPGSAVLACCRMALLPGGDSEEALATFAKYQSRLACVEGLEARFLLFLATRNLLHLAEAHRLLSHLRDHSPEECRESMVANVPLHRDIMAAWEEHGVPQKIRG